jgi:hypothetical protein
MTANEQQQIKKLFNLANIALEFEDLVNMKLVDHWCTIREEHGLAKTLLLIQEYANQNAIKVETPQTTVTNQNPSLVQ